MTTSFEGAQQFSFGDGYRDADRITLISRHGDLELGVTPEGYLVSFNEAQGWVMCADEVTDETVDDEKREYESLKAMSE